MPIWFWILVFVIVIAFCFGWYFDVKSFNESQNHRIEVRDLNIALMKSFFDEIKKIDEKLGIKIEDSYQDFCNRVTSEHYKREKRQ